MNNDYTMLLFNKEITMYSSNYRREIPGHGLCYVWRCAFSTRNEGERDDSRALIPQARWRRFRIVVKLVALARLFMVWVLYVRHPFINDPTLKYTSLGIMLYTLLMVGLSHVFDQISGFTAMFTLINFGISLMMYDHLGSVFSQHILEHKDPMLTITMLIRASREGNFIKRHVTTKALQALFVGRSPMTPAGRAVIFGGLCSGAVWLFNEDQNRRAMDARAAADRQATDARATADRQAADARAAADRHAATQASYQKQQRKAFEAELKAWNDRPFYKKGKKPESPFKNKP